MRQIDINGAKNVKTISYKMKLIENARFMASSLSNAVDNLVQGIYKIKCKYRHYKNVELNLEIVSAFLRT